MSETHRSRLQSVFEAWEAARANGEEPDLAALCGDRHDLLEALRARIAIYESIDPAFAIGGDEEDIGESLKGEGVSQPTPGNVVGKYRLVRKIGEGGFGIVYEAERVGDYTDRVAIKFLRRGIASAEARARFADEAGALAKAKHPHIASVLDAELDNDDTPYLVMELVDGPSLTEFCQSPGLTTSAKLKLMLAVCEAMEQAHRKGVIHRDLKPTNVLVSDIEGRPIPKVIDFGIARIIGPAGGSSERRTQGGALLGTVAYMSPEQLGVVEGDADIGSDIYSLGVMLYEMLCGWLPYQRELGEEISSFQLQHRMSESEPTPLTARMPRGATQEVTTKSDPRATKELDWIAMKCLEADPGRRYASCRELGADIERFLAGEALVAGPRTSAYRARKFIRRHRIGVLTACGVLLVIMTAIAMTLYGLVAAMRGEQRALRAEAEAREIVEFQADRLAAVDIEQMGIGIRAALLNEASSRQGSGLQGASLDERVDDIDRAVSGVNFTSVAGDLLQQSIFEPTVDAIEQRFSDRPQTRGRLLETVATAQLQAGLMKHAEETQRAALGVLRASLGGEHPDVLVSCRKLAATLKETGRAEEAEELLRRALTSQRQLLGADHLETLTSVNDLAVVVGDLGRTEEAEEMYRQALVGCLDALGEDHELTLRVRANLAGELDLQGEFAEAEGHYRAALEGFRATLGERHRDSILSVNNLAVSLFRQGRKAESEPLFRQALEMSRAALGDDHPGTLLAIANTAVLLEHLGRLDDALVLHRESFERRERLFGRDHASTLISMNNLASALRDSGHVDEAMELGSEVVDRAKRAHGPQDWRVGVYQSNVARTVAARGEFAQAAELMLNAHEILTGALGPAHQRVAENAGHLARVYTAWNEHEPDRGHEPEAERWRRAAAGN